MLGWREFCSKGKKIVAALNQLCGEASLLAKNPELLNVTKYCIEGADMLRSIANIWDLALAWPRTTRNGRSKLHSTRTPRLGRYTVKTLQAPCRNWVAVLRSLLVLLPKFH